MQNRPPVPNLQIPANKQRPVRPPPPAAAPLQQVNAIQRMMQQGIPVNQNRPPNAQMTPAMLMMQQGVPQASTPQANSSSSNTTLNREFTEKAGPRTTWVPTPEHDAAIQKLLNGLHRPIKSRPTLTQGLGVNRILGDVLGELLPDDLRALAEGEHVEQRKEDETGLPGQKRRRVQDLASGIDRSLMITPEVEQVGLRYVDIRSRS